jgi:hypothetical protein
LAPPSTALFIHFTPLCTTNYKFSLQISAGVSQLLNFIAVNSRGGKWWVFGSMTQRKSQLLAG